MFFKSKLPKYLILLFAALVLTVQPLNALIGAAAQAQVVDSKVFTKEIESKALLFSNHDPQARPSPLSGSAYELIEHAERSLLFITFTLSDPKTIQLINQKAKQGLEVQIIMDRDHIGRLREALDPKVHIGTRLTGEGHVHHKILVVDEAYVWLGSANFTFGGDKNLAIGFYSPDAGRYLHEEAAYIESGEQRLDASPITIALGAQRLDLYVLPHHQPGSIRPIEQKMNANSCEKILQLIHHAKREIKLSVAVLTYKEISRALIAAKQRGVKVSVCTCDLNQEAVSLLRQAGIPVRSAAAHYKWMLVDDQILLNGSPNWSMNMFSRSDESFILLYDFTAEQLAHMSAIWKNLVN